jgi:hypothetical protein
LVEVRHGIAGLRNGISIDASVPEHEIVLEDMRRLELHVVDGGLALSDVSCQREMKSGTTLSLPVRTDLDGRVDFEPIGEGAYRFALRRADCWPVLLDVQLTKGSETVRRDVEMRRLADLRLQVHNQNGLPVSGVEVELRSSEFDAAVSTWLDEGLVRSSTGLTTNSSGELLIEGLPRGPYTWTIVTRSGDAIGSFELAPATENRVIAQLAE